MNKQELVKAIAETEYFETKKSAEDFLNQFLNIITATIASGQDVRITDFGKFERFTQKDGKQVPKFRPFAALKEKVA